MARHLTRPSRILAAGLFTLIGMAAATPPASAASANPILDLVDCTDSFWVIACAEEGLVPLETDVIVGEPVQIDGDHVCEPTPDGQFVICHTT